MFYLFRGKSGSLKRDRAELEKLLSASVAITTRKKFDGLWTRWRSYADSHSMVSRPARGYDVALFLANLATKKDKTVCTAAASAITWHHSSNGFPSPCSEPIVKTALAGAKRLLGSPVKRTEPMSLKLLRQLVNRSPTSSLELPDLQFHFYIIVAFFGFFRYNDMKRLRIQDFAKRDVILLVTLPSSKTDKFRAGAHVYLAANEQGTHHMPGDGHLRIFQSISHRRAYTVIDDIAVLCEARRHSLHVNPDQTATRRAGAIRRKRR